MAITKEFETGAKLYQKDADSECVYVLKKGSVTLHSHQGQMALEKGDVLGLFDVTLERPYSADAVAASAVTAIVLTKQEVHSLQEGGLIYKMIETSLKKVDADMPGRWS